MRIPIPSNADDLILLAKAIQAKHAELGAASPLNGIEGIENFGAQVDTADTNNKLADSLAKQAETAIETRDSALGSDTTTPGTVRFVVTSAREVLGGLNKGAKHKLGDWGFDVIVSPAAAKPTAKPKSPAA